MLASNIIVEEVVENAMVEKPEKRKSINPNDNLLIQTNSDLSEMLAIIEANVHEDQANDKNVIDSNDDDIEIVDLS